MQKKSISFILLLILSISLYAQAEWEAATFDGIANKHKHLGFLETFDLITLDSAWVFKDKKGKFTTNIQEGILHIRSESEKYSRFSLPLSIDATKDYEICLKVRATEKTTALIWGAGEGSQFEFGYLNLTPHYFVRATRDNDITDLFKPYTQAPQILNKDEFNTFVMRKIDLKYYFFINGTLVYSRPFLKWYGQEVGVLVPPQSEVEVEDIKVYSLSRSTKSIDYAMVPLQIAIKNTDLPLPSPSKDQQAPIIKLTHPLIGRDLSISETQKAMNVEGTLIDESGIMEVSVNGYEATFKDGKFSANLPLALGANTINVTAKDIHNNISTFTFYVQREQETTPAVSAAPQVELKNVGKYYLLLIGVQDYNDNGIMDLENPIQDAQKLKEVLQNTYTFTENNITFLKNPSRNDITKELDRLLEIVQPEDNLLIFYAGHGYWDEKLQQGYWFPADAKRDNRGTWLPNSEVKDYIKAFRSKHTLLITDACFSASIFKTREAFSTQAANEMYKLPSRKAMTSGAMKAVPDNSVFIFYLIKRLAENTEPYLSTEQLFASFKLAVINNSANSQIPQFGVISEAGDEGGDFIFVKK